MTKKKHFDVPIDLGVVYPEFEVNPNPPSWEELRSIQPIDRGLVKAEWLIVRACNIGCAGCTMPAVSKVRQQLDLDTIKKVAYCYHLLGIPFTALYGSEPTMLPLEDLCEIINYLEELKIKNTIITNGIVLNEEKIDKLFNAGLRSLTMSADSINPDEIPDSYIRAKSKKTYKLMPYWMKKYGDRVRDGQITFTVNRQNFKELPEFIKYWSSLGVWTSIDVFHYHHNQEGTKVGPKEESLDLIFRDQDLPEVKKVFEEIMLMKIQAEKYGYRIFTNTNVIARWITGQVPTLSWRCTPTTFITCDSDGTVWFCDDFQPRSYGETMFVWDLITEEGWDKFVKRNKAFMDPNQHPDTCKGCAWATHISAEDIVDGRASIEDYVHGI
jgi:MoaA/NifB/PqqE/SkfB family radical SAM enzyme